MSITADIKDMVAATGGEEAIELRLRRFEEDILYLQSLRDELLREYLDKWVAVYERSLVAQAKTVPQLRKRLVARGVPQNEAVIEFISSERKAMLL